MFLCSKQSAKDRLLIYLKSVIYFEDRVRIHLVSHCTQQLTGKGI